MFHQDRHTQRALELGRIVATPGVLEKVSSEDMIRALSRHRSRDWGELEAQDRSANDMAVADRTRILSAYTSSNRVKFWIITEADRSATTVLLPEEY